MNPLARFQEVFVPLFVALSPLSVLPVFLSMTDRLSMQRRDTLTRKAVATAFLVAIGITLLGQQLFRLLDITVNDLRVGGGLIMLVIAVHDLLFSREERKRKEANTDIGVVPLGTPLIVGPATMTACLVLADTHGKIAVFLALVINMAMIWGILHYAHRLSRYIDQGVSRAFGKVMSLLLAAIAAGTMRVGIMNIAAEFGK